MYSVWLFCSQIRKHNTGIKRKFALRFSTHSRLSTERRKSRSCVAATDRLKGRRAQSQQMRTSSDKDVKEQCLRAWHTRLQHTIYAFLFSIRILKIEELTHVYVHHTSLPVYGYRNCPAQRVGITPKFTEKCDMHFCSRSSSTIVQIAENSRIPLTFSVSNKHSRQL